MTASFILFSIIIGLIGDLSEDEPDRLSWTVPVTCSGSP